MNFVLAFFLGYIIGVVIIKVLRAMKSEQPNLAAHRSGYQLGVKSATFADVIARRLEDGAHPSTVAGEIDNALTVQVGERGWRLQEAKWTRDPNALVTCETHGEAVVLLDDVFKWMESLDGVPNNVYRGVRRQGDGDPSGPALQRRRKILTDRGIDVAELQKLFNLNDDELTAWADGWQRARSAA